MKRVLLAIITEADVCSASFCSSLAETLNVSATQGVQFFPVFLKANGNWSMAFNQAVTYAVEGNADGLITIDPNVSWSPQTLIDLSKTDKDAVGVPVTTQGGFDVALGEVSRLQEDEETGEIKVLRSSLDFFYLSPYAAKTLYDAHPSAKYFGTDVKLVLQSGDIYSAYYTPSEILSYRLKEQNIEVWLSSKHTAYKHDRAVISKPFREVLEALKENG